MKATAKRIILKNKAKNVLTGKYYAAISMLIFWLVLSFLLEQFDVSIVNNVYQNPTIASNVTLFLTVSYFIFFIFNVFAEILQAGICLFHLKLSTGNPAYTFDLLYGYFHQFKKFFCLSCVKSLVTFICTMPLRLILDFYNSSAFFQSQTFVLLLPLQLIGLAIFFPVNLSLSQAYFLAFDYPELNYAELIKQSAKIMNGRKRHLFMIQLSFLPLFILGILSFGLGLLWVIPYYYVTLTLYYLDIMKPQDE